MEREKKSIEIYSRNVLCTGLRERGGHRRRCGVRSEMQEGNGGTIGTDGIVW